MSDDYELLYLSKEDIEPVVDILYKKYKQILYCKAIKYSSKNDLDDFLNEAKLTLYEAVENYRDTYAFLPYLNICLDRRLTNYKKQQNRNKYKILNESLYLNDIDTNSLISIQDNKYEPERVLLEEISYQSLREKIIAKLTWKEELVLVLKEQNYTNKEISNIIGGNIRTIYNIINRIKNKISNLVSN